MMHQTEFTAPTPLLDHRGRLAARGYARKMHLIYDRSQVRANPFALKEWDFYQILQGNWVLQLTIGHVSYAANMAVTLLNLATGERLEYSKLKPLPLRSIPMPENPERPNRIALSGRGWSACWTTEETTRRLWVRGQDAALGTVAVDLTLPNNPDNEKMVIATPFEKPNQFYCNYKENFWGCTGAVTIGGRTVRFDSSATAVLDWGRGVWPFTQEWFWGNGTAFLQGEHFGFNIGWGFGDLSHATENMFFYRDKAYKLGGLRVERDETDYERPWHFVSEDGGFDFVMEPVFDHYTEMKLAFVNKHCHQVHGRWTGKAVLPDGTVLAVREMTAFCEHAVNRW